MKHKGLNSLFVTMEINTEPYGEKILTFNMRDDETLDGFFSRMKCVRLFISKDELSDIEKENRATDLMNGIFGT